MEKIDLRSVYALLAFMNFFIPLVTWGVTKKESSRAINYWCLGGILGAVGTMMSAFNNPTYEILLIILTELFLLFSILYRIEGILSFLGTRQSMYLWIPLTFCLSIISANPFFDFQQTAIFIHALFYTRLVYFLWKLGLRPDGRSIWFTCIGYILVIIVLALISIKMNMGLIPSSYLDPNFLTIALAFLGAFVIFSGYVGVVGVVLERNRIREIKSTEERARLESNRLLTHQISTLQRKQIVDQMSTTLAHELSQPLAIAMSGSQSIQRQIKLNDKLLIEDLESNMDIVINSIKRMTSLLDRIRAFLRADSLVIEHKFLNLSRVVNEVVNMMNWHANGNGISIKATMPKNPIRIIGDRIQITQILTNLLMNSIDSCLGSTSAFKEICINLAQEGSRVLVTVADNGIGFTLDSLNHAGEPFFTTKKDGLGLGLSICKSIAQQHGAQLTWANNDYGGAVVSLDFNQTTSANNA